MNDLHLHTAFSFDSSELPENYVKAAIARGCKAVGFSEHYDYDAFLDKATDVELCDVGAYFNSLNRLRQQYADDICLLAGIELGYRAEATEHYNALTKKFPFDYVINSLHTLANRGDCYHDNFFKGWELKDSYMRYLEGVLESVTSDLDYDIVGHLGYASRYRKGEDVRLKYRDFSGILDEILQEIIRRDKCLELNTSVGSSGSDFLPDRDIVERYLQLGGKKLSFGSDAHRAVDFMRRSSEAADFLKSAGVEELYYFKGRVAVSYKI